MEIENSQTFINNVYQKKLNYEDEYLDYKLLYKFSSQKDKLELVKDIVSFANTNGGFIIYGVRDKNFSWEGIDAESNELNDIQIKEFLNKYIDTEIFFKCGRYSVDGKLFYLITVEKLNNEPIAFIKDGEYERIMVDKTKQLCCVFHCGDIYGRVGSSCRRINDDPFFFQKRKSEMRLISNLSSVRAPYRKYVNRVKEKETLINALETKNIRYVQINGIGGIGKTSLVYNLCDEIINKTYKPKFKVCSIIWLTGKMNYFTADGEISEIRDVPLSFEEVLCQLTDILMINTTSKKDDEILHEIIDKLEIYPALFVFDNMETIKDNRIDSFFLNLPDNCKCIFTTRVNMSSSHLRIDITGFNSQEFEQYIINALEEYRPTSKDAIYANIKPYLSDFLELTYGSPIIMNFLIKKICSGYPIRDTLEALRNMNVNSGSILSSIMEFCFNETFDKLTNLQKQILFVMSISESDFETFEVADLSYIVNASDDNVLNALVHINESSFCEFDGKAYSCSSLVKAFLNKKISIFETKLSLKSIADKYYEWSKNKNNFNDKENLFFNKVKAYNFKKKMIVTKLSNYKFEYEKDHDFDDLLDKIDDLIKSCSDYAYLYYEKAKLLFAQNYEAEANEFYLKSIEKDPANDYYLSEYAFYLYKTGHPKESIKVFKKALKIKPDLSNVNHGLAVALCKVYNSDPNSNIDEKEILSYFEKGYVDETIYYSQKIKFCRNAHSHAAFLLHLKQYSKALEICNKALEMLPEDYRINSLKGNILTRMNPERVSETKLLSAKQGLFASLSDDEMKKIFEMIDD